MNKRFEKLLYFAKNPAKIFVGILYWTAGLWPDKIYVKINYFLHTKKRLNLEHPRSFNEKLQWLKLYNHQPEYTRMVDKIEVKDFVKNKIGQQYIIHTLGVWDSAKEIDFERLPNTFVLKTNHSGGGTGVVIVKDKSTINEESVRLKLQKSLEKDDIALKLREWPYKDVKRRILAEEMLSSENGDGEIHDYKFYCFNGKPLYILISNERHTGHVKFDYFDADFNHLPLRQGGDNFRGKVEKPKNFELMKELASKLSEGIPHVRVDFYDVDGKVYFGEMTFFDSSGFAEFDPNDWNYVWGNKIKIPEKTL